MARPCFIAPEQLESSKANSLANSACNCHCDFKSVGMIIIGYGFNLKNFTIIKYLVSYLGAIAIGVNLSSENILRVDLLQFV